MSLDLALFLCAEILIGISILWAFGILAKFGALFRRQIHHSESRGDGGEESHR